MEVGPNHDDPYVGPRSIRTGEKLYGRDTQSRELTELLVAERVVLLHSPSGAGKTSLIQASLIPELLKLGFEMLPTIRVGTGVTEAPPGQNRYILGALMSLVCQPCVESAHDEAGGASDEEEAAAAKQALVESLASMTLPGYVEEKLKEACQREKEILDAQQAIPLEELSEDELLTYVARRHRASGGGGGSNVNLLLIFDQFEEIILLDPTDERAKRQFFEQLGRVLRDRRVWALFSMREDYVAALEPYLDSIPTRLNTRYRIDFLGREAALEAVRMPAVSRGVVFEVDPVDGSDAADLLVDDLRMVSLQRPSGELKKVPGLYVEPVHLQVVCRRLWTRMSARWNASGEGATKTIAKSDIETGEDVDKALAGYYEERVLKASRSDTEERLIRRWFEENLITGQGFRGQVQREVNASKGLSNEIIEELLESFLIREEVRLGAVWYELAHDRLIEPIRSSNTKWREEALLPFQRKALTWQSHGRSDSFLLTARELNEAQNEIAKRSLALLPEERDFLERSNKARQQALKKWGELRKRQQLRNLTFLSIGSLAVAAAAVILIILLVNANEAATRSSYLSDARKFAALAADNITVNPERSMLLALHGVLIASEVDEENIDFDLLESLNLAAQKSKVRHTFSGHADTVTSLSYSPDGNLLATASADATVKIWSTVSGKLLRTRAESKDTIYAVAFGRRCDGKQMLAAAGNDGRVRLGRWDEEKLDELSVAGARFFTVAFGGGARWLAAGGNKTVAVWDIEHGGAQRPGPWARSLGEGESVYGVAFNSDATLLAVAGSRGVRVWDVAAGALRYEDLSGEVYGVAFGPPAPKGGGGELLALARGDGTASVLEGQTWKVVGRPLVGHMGKVYGVSFDDEGRRLVTAGEDKMARVWDIKSSAELYSLIGHGSRVRAAAFSPNGRDIATASEDGTAKIWAGSYGHTASVVGAAFNREGSQLVSLDADGTIILQDVKTGEELFTAFAPSVEKGNLKTTPAATDADHPHKVTYKAIAFRDELVPSMFIAKDDQVEVWRGRGKTIEKTDREYKHEQLLGMAFSPEGGLLATTGKDGAVKLWDALRASCLVKFEPDTGAQRPCADEPPEPAPKRYAVTAVALNKGAELLATGSEDGTVRVWRIGKRKSAGGQDEAGVELPTPLKTFYGHTSAVYAIAFDNDARRLATGGEDKVVKVWSLDDSGQKLLRNLSGHVARVNSAAFNQDGSLLATASADGTSKVWDTRRPDVPTESAIWQIKASLSSGGSVNVVAFGPDAAAGATAPASSKGSLLVTAGDDRSVYFHILPTEGSVVSKYRFKELLANRVLRQLTRPWTVDECREYLGGDCHAEYEAVEAIIEGNRDARDRDAMLEEAVGKYKAAIDKVKHFSTNEKPEEAARLVHSGAISRQLNNYATANEWTNFTKLVTDEAMSIPAENWPFLMRSGSELVRYRRVDEAIELFRQGRQKFEQTGPADARKFGFVANLYNYLCFYGALSSKDKPEVLEKVVPFCQQAVKVAEEHGLGDLEGYKDSYGIALSFIPERREEAVTMFEAFAASTDSEEVSERRVWIQKIKRGEKKIIPDEFVNKYLPESKAADNPCPPP